jgi:hypothetical protein
MKLSAPSVTFFLLSTALVLVTLMSKYFGAHVPFVSSVVNDYPFQTMLIAWAILFAGVAFNI